MVLVAEFLTDNNQGNPSYKLLLQNWFAYKFRWPNDNQLHITFRMCSLSVVHYGIVPSK